MNLSVYLSGSHGVLVACDATDRTSFECIPNIVTQVKKYAPPDVCCIIIEFYDLAPTVRTEEATALAERLGTIFKETPKSGPIDSVLMTLCR